jgi:dimethylsulfoniopropionate demethylase
MKPILAQPVPHTPAILAVSRRTRRTPFSPMVEAAGVRAYTVYNHMLLPATFRSVSEDYLHLCAHVQVWDVGCERQVEIKGPDAARLVQMMTPRDLSKAVDLQCLYVPMCNTQGGIINDPIAIRISHERWWLSIADSDVMLWAQGLAHGLGLNVQISEPNVWPLAIQGPKSDELAARVFGDDVTKLKFFRSGWFDYQGHKFLVARSGWSKQGGFEVYLDRPDLAAPLWAELFEKGVDLNVGPGCPNLIERIEGGLMSWGNDITAANNPYEAGMNKYCHPDRVDCIGRDALLAIREKGPQRLIRGLKIDAEAVPPCVEPWPLTFGGTFAGSVTSAAVSPRLGSVGMGMVEIAHAAPGTHLTMETQYGTVDVTVAELPFQ